MDIEDNQNSKPIEKIEDIKETPNLISTPSLCSIKLDPAPSSEIEGLRKSSNINNTYTSLPTTKIRCPLCTLIPALFTNTDTTSIFQVCSSCENGHLISNKNFVDFYNSSCVNSNYHILKCSTCESTYNLDKLDEIQYNVYENITPEKEFFYCSSCSEYFCDNCAVVHNKNNSNFHNIINVNCRDFICIDHKEKLVNFCEICKKNLCIQCLSTDEHKNHTLRNFQNIIPDNKEIKILNDQIKYEREELKFLKLKFEEWLLEVKKKFNELTNNEESKLNLYEKILDNFNIKELNYQSIHNLKFILQNQTENNQIIQESKRLKNLLEIKNDNELKFYEKGKLFMQLINLEKICQMNKNGKKQVFESFYIRKDKALNEEDEKINENSDVEEEYDCTKNGKNITPFSNNVVHNIIDENNDMIKAKEEARRLMGLDYNNNVEKQNIKKNNMINKNINNNIVYRKIDDTEVKNLNNNIYFLANRKLKHKLDLKTKVKAIARLQGNQSDKIVIGLDNGKLSVYSISIKNNDTFFYFFTEINLHNKGISFITSLSNGKFISSSYDNTMCVVGLTESYIWSYFKTYYLIQTLQGLEDGINILTCVELKNGLLASGDWKHILIWKNKEENSQNFYSKYEIFRDIQISTRITSIVEVSDEVFTSVHYGDGTVSFYNSNYPFTCIKSIKGCKCTDNCPYSCCLIQDKNDSNKKYILVGGYRTLYIIDTVSMSLLSALEIPGNDYVNSMINSDIYGIGKSIIMGGKFCNIQNLEQYEIYFDRNSNKINMVLMGKISGISEGNANCMIKYTFNQLNDTLLIVGFDDGKINLY